MKGGLVWFDLMRKVIHFSSQTFSSSIESFRLCISIGATPPPPSLTPLPVLKVATWRRKKHWVKKWHFSDIGSVLHQPCAVPGFSNQLISLSAQVLIIMFFMPHIMSFLDSHTTSATNMMRWFFYRTWVSLVRLIYGSRCLKWLRHVFET